MRQQMAEAYLAAGDPARAEVEALLDAAQDEDAGVRDRAETILLDHRDRSDEIAALGAATVSPPMLLRSTMRVVFATRQPSLSSPTR